MQEVSWEVGELEEMLSTMQFRYSRLEVQELLGPGHSGEGSGIWKLFKRIEI